MRAARVQTLRGGATSLGPTSADGCGAVKILDLVLREPVSGSLHSCPCAVVVAGGWFPINNFKRRWERSHRERVVSV
jgi:hypothetical protein